jgi:nitrate reductase assembly molybdenum cofactor insertion protein NarJ
MEHAAGWRLLAQIFSYPCHDWAARNELLLECIADARLAELARKALSESSPELWMRLFGPGGAVRARAVAWEGGLQPGYLLAELAAYYEAFGYEPPEDSAPDELSVLLDFAAWLEVKLAYACVQEDRDSEEITRRALETFLCKFVAPAAWPVFRQLEHTGPEFLVEAAQAAAERSGAEPAAREWMPWGGLGDEQPDADCCGAPPLVDIDGGFPGPGRASAVGGGADR